MSKWCRCEEPLLGKDYYTAIEIDMDCRNPTKCVKCGKDWRKYKNFRGTELIDHPPGTVFAILNAERPIWVRVVRYRDVLVLESNAAYPHGEWKLVIHEGSILLQDRFEIVEDSDE